MKSCSDVVKVKLLAGESGPARARVAFAGWLRVWAGVGKASSMERSGLWLSRALVPSFSSCSACRVMHPTLPRSPSPVQSWQVGALYSHTQEGWTCRFALLSDMCLVRRTAAQLRAVQALKRGFGLLLKA